MPVYDEEKEKIAKSEGAHDDLGIEPDLAKSEVDSLQKQFEAPSAVDPKDLKTAEERAGSPNSTGEMNDDNKSALGDDTIGEGYKADGGSRRRIRITKNQGIIGGSAALVVGGGIGILVFLQGPLQIVHFAQLLQRFHFSNNEDFMDGRTARFMYGVRNGSVGTARANTRLGTINNKFANKVELRLQRDAGLRSLYDSSTGRLIGYEITDLNQAVNFLGDNLDQNADFDLRAPNELPDDIRNRALSIDGTRPTGGVITFRDEKFKFRRTFTRQITKAVSTSKLGGSISSRLLIERAGIDFHPLKNITREPTDNIIEWFNKQRSERAKRRQSGDAPNISAPTADNGDDNNDGTPDRAVDPDLKDAENAASEALDDITGVDSTDIEATSQLRSRILQRMGSAAAAVGILCTVRSLGNQSEALQHTQIILPMMRMGGEIITTGSQVMSGRDVNVDELGSIITDLDDEDGTSWAAARSIQAELGQEQTGPDIPPYAKPSEVGEKPEFFKVIDSIPGLSSACGVQDTVGNLPVIKQIGNFSGEIIGKVLPIDQLVDGIVGWLAGDAVNTFATGPELGNIANYGARLAANDHAIGIGGRELSTIETAQLDNLSRERLNDERAEKSFFAKVFDINDVDSVVAKASDNFPHSTAEIVTGLFHAPTMSFAKIFQPVSAQSTYDYGFNEFGFSQPEQDDVRLEDPLENAEIVENQLGIDSLNADFSDCFSMQISSTGEFISGGSKEYSEIPDNCYTDADGNGIEDNERLLRYRMYIADMIAAHSLACYEGEEESCAQLSLGETATVQTEGPKGSATANCTIGTPYLADGKGATSTDGIWMTGENQDIPIRVCVVQGFAVNVLVESAVNNMINAARKDQVELRQSSGFRTYEHQVTLRKQNCGTSEYAIYQMPSSQCSPETAKPGTSNHEDGLAIDFSGIRKCPTTQNGGCADPSDASWRWLNNNAINFGFTQYSREAWHWSTNGG